MHRSLLAVLALLVVGVLAGTAAASHEEGSGGPNDFAVGSLTTFPESSELTAQKFRFSAHSSPSGEDPRGHVVVDFSGLVGDQRGFQGKGHVTCLRVPGLSLPGSLDRGDAVMEAELDEPLLVGTRTFTHIVILASDFGDDTVVEDRAFLGFRTASSTPPACGGPGVSFGGETPGNITIHDATP